MTSHETDHSKKAAIKIISRDYWVQVVEMLQQNWALVDVDQEGAIVRFIDDGSGVWDEMRFPSETDAKRGLVRNGFKRYAADNYIQKFLTPPKPPFHSSTHSNGPVYSSGRFWIAE